MAQYVSPNSQPIVSVLESVECFAGISDIDPVTGEPEYNGESDIDWDFQGPIIRLDSRVYIDEGGDHWTFSQLTMVSE